MHIGVLLLIVQDNINIKSNLTESNTVQCNTEVTVQYVCINNANANAPVIKLCLYIFISLQPSLYKKEI